MNGQYFVSRYRNTTKNNIKVYAIGVGKVNMNVGDLSISANGNSTDRTRVLTVSSYSQLSDEISTITASLSNMAAEGEYFHIN